MQTLKGLTMILVIFTVITIFGCVSCNVDVKLKMEEHAVVPDVIQNAPIAKLSVTYENNKIVELGNELTPTQVKNEPKVTWEAEPDTYYTLAMVDPDAPSRAEPTYREVNHWLVGNIKGAEPKLGDVITGYTGSGPPKGTGLHRYVFLLYKQAEEINFDEPKTPSDSRRHRLSTSIKKVAEKYNLGEPIAGNFFQAQWDEYVEIRRKNIKD